MKEQIKFFRKLIFIIVPVLIVSVFFEVNARNISNGFLMKRNLMDLKKGKIEFLVLGSSHGNYGINPEMISENSFNLTFNSQDIYYDSKLFDEYKDGMVNLKCVVFTLSNFSLWYDLNDSPEKWRKYFYKEFFGINLKSPMSAAEIVDLKSYSFAFFYGFLNTLLGTINPDYLAFGTDMNSHGWNIDSGKVLIAGNDSVSKGGKERMEFTDALIRKENTEYNLKLLKGIIDYTIGKKIKLVFVTTPVTGQYFKYLDKDRFNEFLSTVSMLADNKNVYFLNFINDGRFTAQDFRDYDHVNGKGASKFSSILKDTLGTLNIYKSEK
jgi:hypothetical protein